jgi:hypothetical protein
MISDLFGNPWKVLVVAVVSAASWAGASAVCRCPVSASRMPRLFSDMARAGRQAPGLGRHHS